MNKSTQKTKETSVAPPKSKDGKELPKCKFCDKVMPSKGPHACSGKKVNKNKVTSNQLKKK